MLPLAKWTCGGPFLTCRVSWWLLLQGVGFKYQDHTVIVELAHNDTIEGAHPTLCCTAT